jgi:hypothetical protein
MIQSNQILNYGNPILGKVFAFILFIVFVFLIIMISLTFIAPKKYENKKKYQIAGASIQNVWEASNNIIEYQKSRENLYKLVVKDTLKLSFVEYYSPSDSMEYKTIVLNPNQYKKYKLINWKYEQFNTIEMRLDSIPNAIEVTFSETSIYQNVWARVYNTILAPNTTLDFEFFKIKSLIKS